MSQIRKIRYLESEPGVSTSLNAAAQSYVRTDSAQMAVLASEIEQLPDLTGYLKLASRSDWLKIQMSHS